VYAFQENSTDIGNKGSFIGPELKPASTKRMTATNKNNHADNWNMYYM